MVETIKAQTLVILSILRRNCYVDCWGLSSLYHYIGYIRTDPLFDLCTVLYNWIYGGDNKGEKGEDMT